MYDTLKIKLNRNAYTLIEINQYVFMTVDSYKYQAIQKFIYIQKYNGSYST